MPKSPSVSVALATFNGAKHLPEQLNSLAAQTLAPSELVVCDDGSTDRTIPLLEEFGRAVPFPVRVESNPERLGYRRNFRKAASLCAGELIAFCDQDDVWHARKLERLAEAFGDPSIQLAYHNANVVDGAGKFLRSKHDGELERLEISRRPMDPWKSSYGLLQMFRASLRRFDGLWDMSIDHNDRSEILAHDQWYFLLASLTGNIVFIEEPLIDYRQHGANLYGAPAKRGGMLSRVGARFVHYGRPDAELATAARARAAICAAVTALDPASAQQARLAGTAYALLADRLARRYAIYAAPTGAQRLSALARSMGNRDYCGKPWGFEPVSVARDLWSGVLWRRIDDPGFTPPPVRTPAPAPTGAKVEFADKVEARR